MAYKKDLGNTRLLLQHLDSPHLQFKSIHIAGTNGKGSTSHMMAAIMQTAGYKTGLYTSPHLRDFRERIRVNGVMVEKDFVILFTQKIKPVIESIEPSFFEVTVAMAFAWFAAQKVDVAVVETGMGGRLDSTNIISPEISIITNIGWDHMNILGDSLEKIAFEKAGIIKRNTPAIVGEVLPETRTIFTQKAAEENAPLLVVQDEYKVLAVAAGIDHLRVTIKTPEHEVLEFQTDLPGLYQQHNVLTVHAAAQLLQRNGWPLTQDHIRHGIAHAASLTNLQGRWQVLHKKPWVVADVAHNVDGMSALCSHLQAIRHLVRDVHIVYATSADKDVDAIFPMLPRDVQYYFTKAQIPRAMHEDALMQKAAAYGIEGSAYADVMKALTALAPKAQPDDLVMVCGSVFMVGEIEEDVIPSLFAPGA